MMLLITSSETLDNQPHLLDWAIRKDEGRSLWESMSGLVNGYGSHIDRLAAEYAEKEGIEVIPFKLGDRDRGLRNTDMVKVADTCLAVWDGSSKDTEDVIKKAVSSGLTTFVFYAYHHKSWPVNPVIYLPQRGQTLQHFKLAGGRYIQNYFSNFFPFEEPLEIDGITFEYPENAYQALKSRDRSYREKIASLTPGQAKRLSRKVGTTYSKRADWFQFNFKAMFNIQKHRIETGPLFRAWLKETRGQPIIEWANWKDDYWAMNIDTCEGSNWLGRILMILRDHKLVEL